VTTKPKPPLPWLNTLAASLLTVLLLALCTWGELALQDISAVKRLYTIFYLIPVAVGAALLGIRGGILSALAAVLIARFYLFTDNKHGLALISFPSLAESIEFSALLLGTLTIAFITGRLRSTLGDLNETNASLQEANARLIESEQQRRVFNRDVLLAVTGGKLRLVEHDEMPPPDLLRNAPALKRTLRVPADASALRSTLTELGRSVGMDRERIGDLCTAATEAATNAIKHGNGGQATIWSDADAVTVQIEDQGTGIAPAHLARATLEQGYSTRVSLGMGFHLMLQATDALTLCTDSQGTIIFLQVSNKPRQTPQEAVLAQYAGIV
jgi:anti-sigma regulatory factor (Ser/Thr protein kinase)